MNNFNFKIFNFVLIYFLIITLGFTQEKKEPYIPLEKGLSTAYIQSLYEKGTQKIYSGKELTHIAMPCGGIGAGQVEITGNGELIFTESIYNKMQEPNAGHGLSTGYQYINPQLPVSKVENGFEIDIKSKNGENIHLKLNGADFDNIQFVGEYPMAQMEYLKKNMELPVSIKSKVFSPFVPLSVRNSANPVTVLQYTLKNNSAKSVNVTVSGNLTNILFPESGKVKYKNKANRYKGVSGISMEMIPLSNSDATLLKHPQLGAFSLAVLDKGAKLAFNDSETLNPEKGAVSSSISLAPGQAKEVTFMVSWYFPNYYENGKRYKEAMEEAPGWVGHVYNNWYNSAFDVAKYVGVNYNELRSETQNYVDTYHNNSLPYWLANRISMPVSTLAAGNIAIWKNGRLFGYEGVGFCQGTCGHVYNFVATISNLFPELERSVRLMQDFSSKGPYSAYSKSGRINFRGYGVEHPEYKHGYASDAQSGYVLKAYREHLMSVDNSFLDSVWTEVKGAIGYHIYKDGAEIGLEPNGVLEGIQTFWDPMWYGPNPYNNTLYLAALRAAEEMAKIKGELVLANRYRNLFIQGQDYMNKKLWNGEFYFHLYPNGFRAKDTPNGFIPIVNAELNAERFIENFNNGGDNYYEGGGCDAQQLFGQNWANQLGLGYILPQENCIKAAESIFKYNWTPDIATVYDAEKPNARILAATGEGAMVNGSWPHKKPLFFENKHDKSNIWSGLEYEAACDMINEGLVDEALIIIKAINDRYDGIKRNPWNEIEGSDHYSRAMQSWNVLRSLSGYTYDGPAGKLSFYPKITPHNFKSFFSGAEGWGNISQLIDSQEQIETVEVKWGQLKLKEFKFKQLNATVDELVKVSLEGKSVQFSLQKNGGELNILFDSQVVIKKGQKLVVQIK